jgi:diacylglycerol kinase family enzyme
VWNDGYFPLLLPLRGGTINNLSHSLGGRRCSAERLLTQVVERVRRGHTHDVTECDLMLVNGRYYGYIVGAAMIVNFLRLYYAGARPGPVRALWLLARLGVSYLLGTSTIEQVAAPIEAEVTCDGARLPFTNYRLLLASSVASIGLGVKPFYLSGRESGRFHVLAGPSTPGELLVRLPRFYRGAPAELATLFDSAASVVRIEFAEPQAFTINGDIPAEQVKVLELRPGPRVRLIRG